MSVHHPASAHDHSDLTAELQASRVRIVEAADEARRRLERDLHDGAQQRFLSASMLLGLIRRQAHGHDPQLTDLLDRLAGELDAGLTELRELAHGIHPAVLTDRGLRTAVDALAARSPVPVYVEGDLEERPARSVESALYFAVAEALTNVAKHSPPVRHRSSSAAQTTRRRSRCATTASAARIRQRARDCGGWSTGSGRSAVTCISRVPSEWNDAPRDRAARSA